jgi:hypothetical protein
MIACKSHGALPQGRMYCEYCDEPGVSSDPNISTEQLFKDYHNCIDNLKRNTVELKNFPVPSAGQMFAGKLLNLSTLGIYGLISSKNSKDPFKYKCCECDKLIEKINTTYNKDRIAIKTVNNCREEMEYLKQDRRRLESKSNLWSTLFMILFIVFIIFIFFSPLPEPEETLSIMEKDELILKKIEEDLSDQNYEAAKLKTSELSYYKQLDMLRTIQQVIISNKIDQINSLITEGKYNEAEKRFGELKWVNVEDPNVSKEEQKNIELFNQKVNQVKKSLNQSIYKQIKG